MSQQKTIPERSAIPQPDTWNTADLYPTDQAWQEDFVRLQGLTTRLAEYEGRLGGDRRCPLRLFDPGTGGWRASGIR